MVNTTAIMRHGGEGSPQAKQRGTAAQREHIDAVVHQAQPAVQQALRWMLLHLLHQRKRRLLGYTERDTGGWTPIPYDHIREHITGDVRRSSAVWAGCSVIVPKDHGAFGDEKCRRFRLAEHWASAFDRLGGGVRRYKLHTPDVERTAPQAARTTDLTNTSRNGYPEPLNGALRRLKDAPHYVDRSALTDALEAMPRPSYGDASGPASGPATSDRDKRAGRLSNVRLALQWIDRQTVDEPGTGGDEPDESRDASGGFRPRSVYDGDASVQADVVCVQNAYEVQPLSGRLGMKGGGVQGMLGAVKQEAYGTLNGVHNYDIRSCHTQALLTLCDEIQEVTGREIDTAPLTDYLGRGGKDWAVQAYPVPRHLVKTVEHSVKMGAALPRSAAQAARMSSELPGTDRIAVQEAVESTYSKSSIRRRMYGFLYDIFHGIHSLVQEVAGLLVGDYYEAVKQPGGPAGWGMKNPCGLLFRPSAHEAGHKRRSKAMASFLQGYEAAYVAHLVCLQDDYDYEVMGCEYDGVITLGEIPQAAQNEAAQRSGFDGAELVQKRFASGDEWDAVYNPAPQDAPDESGPVDGPANGPATEERTDGPAAQTAPLSAQLQAFGGSFKRWVLEHIKQPHPPDAQIPISAVEYVQRVVIGSANDRPWTVEEDHSAFDGPAYELLAVMTETDGRLIWDGGAYIVGGPNGQTLHLHVHSRGVDVVDNAYRYASRR